ncbi:DUF4166 domain-containing protein [Pelagibius sp. Alg239-R121]|uniref:DUF4166 domain-containing protein n=1 Tax=Pelagibius sp. Alg239-R121 TaxID=2993448 RepID=UPI0024A66203|nr:DUF4166 domain-containing protein [Pelagibius sp. Alg239-R121]
MTLYQRVLGEKFAILPDAVRRAHSFEDQQILEGEADVLCSESLIGRCLLWLFGLPRAGKGLRTRVRFQQEGNGERWERSFGSDSFSTRLTPLEQQPGCILETKGLVSAVVRLLPASDGLIWEVEAFRLLELPLPQFLAPKTTATESEANGRYHFDMTISLPVIGQFITYRGWLKPA